MLGLLCRSFACMYASMRVLDTLELELQTAVSCRVVAGK